MQLRRTPAQHDHARFVLKRNAAFADFLVGIFLQQRQAAASRGAAWAKICSRSASRVSKVAGDSGRQNR